MASRSDIEKMIGGAGLFAGIFTDLCRSVKGLGGGADDIHQLARPEGGRLIQQFARILVKRNYPGETLVDIQVPVNRDANFIQQAKSAGYRIMVAGHDETNSFEQENFFDLHPTGESLTNQIFIRILVVRVGKDLTSCRDFHVQITRLGFRFGSWQEMFAVDRQVPSLFEKIGSPLPKLYCPNSNQIDTTYHEGGFDLVTPRLWLNGKVRTIDFVHRFRHYPKNDRCYDQLTFGEDDAVVIVPV